MACKHCKSETANGATHCQFCGEELYRVQRKEGMLYHILIAIILVMLLIFFLSMRDLPIF
jgi:tetrahydromethanopterin S-methyltransferase subunit G